MDTIKAHKIKKSCCSQRPRRVLTEDESQRLLAIGEFQKYNGKVGNLNWEWIKKKIDNTSRDVPTNYLKEKLRDEKKRMGKDALGSSKPTKASPCRIQSQAPLEIKNLYFHYQPMSTSQIDWDVVAMCVEKVDSRTIWGKEFVEIVKQIEPNLTANAMFNQYEKELKPRLSSEWREQAAQGLFDFTDAESKWIVRKEKLRQLEILITEGLANQQSNSLNSGAFAHPRGGLSSDGETKNLRIHGPLFIRDNNKFTARTDESKTELTLDEWRALMVTAVKYDANLSICSDDKWNFIKSKSSLKTIIPARKLRTEFYKWVVPQLTDVCGTSIPFEKFSIYRGNTRLIICSLIYACVIYREKVHHCLSRISPFLNYSSIEEFVKKIHDELQTHNHEYYHVEKDYFEFFKRRWLY